MEPEACQWDEKDLEDIRAANRTMEAVCEEIEIFRKGFPFTRLHRPCRVGDGIIILQENEIERLTRVYTEAALAGRAIGFVPASGAASRMFQSLLSMHHRGNIPEQAGAAAESAEDKDSRAFAGFVEEISSFAFHEDLKEALGEAGLDLKILLNEFRYQPILECLLTAKGLNLANLPKGLIKFHCYPDRPRTPLEEHMVEAAGYMKDKHGKVHLHFTISPEHEMAIRRHIAKVRDVYEIPGLSYEVTLSAQETSTDTIAVDMENRPFRDGKGGLVFRPGGHGALLGNLNRLKGDIVFVKNIDNVVPDRLKTDTWRYKKALGGYLVEMQRHIHHYMRRLLNRDQDEGFLDEIMAFAMSTLFIVPPEGYKGFSGDGKRAFLVQKLNRPLRVCGMVRNQGEPGGGPFWVGSQDGALSLQIVESSQVDMCQEEQKAIWHSSTHFNPVDLVCALRDCHGDPFDLTRFRDPDTGYISIKSKEGRSLKALEHPGLWNGAMAHWNTLFVEVPVTTFNPVKTVLDLLRPQHRS